MPYFKLDTNVPRSKITPDFLKSTSKLVASTLGKPESYVVVQVNGDQSIIWGGTEEPCGYATLMSIGKLGIEENKKHAAAIYEHLLKHLGIPGDRMYINFVDSAPSTVGYNGSTFHPILGNK
uniref:L-dopachrome isomerase n=1 Tax=Maconellicoccus hirsutus TaxID=177089 RepID=A2I461_MACHI|nr:macrophage migration inhibitory factor-like protein [Maconellicoccus hirsutus]